MKDKIIRDCRDPQSKDNIFRQLFAEFSTTKLHVIDRNIFGVNLKTLEATMMAIREDVQKIRRGENVEETAEHCQELIQQARTVMTTLIQL